MQVSRFACVASDAFLLLFVGGVFQLVAFSSVLWSISSYLVLFLVLYAVVGTMIAFGVFGEKMVTLYFHQRRVEADFRFGLVRIRENAEAIAGELPYGCLEPHSDYHGMGIALRCPGKYERIPLHYRDARRAVLEPSDWQGLAQAIELVNVHFQAPHAIRPFPSAWVRWQQVRGLERFFGENPTAARVVIGDCNATPGWPLYRRLTRDLRDGALEIAKRERRPAAATFAA